MVKERLGVEVRPGTDREAEHHGMDTPQGEPSRRWIRKARWGRPGLRCLICVLAIEGQPIEGGDGLVGLVAALKPHQRVTVVALDHRSGETGSVEAGLR